MPIMSPSTVAADAIGNLWICGWNEGVFVLPRGEDQFKKVAPGPVPFDVRTFVDLGDGVMRLWVMRLLSMLRFPTRAWGAKRPLANFTNSAGEFLVDRDGSDWMATEGSIWRVPDVERLQGRVSPDDPSLEKFTPAEGLTSGDIEAIMEDREGSVWIATSGGLDRFRPRNAVSTALQRSDSGIDLVAGGQGAVWASSPEILKDCRNGKQVPGSPPDIQFAFKDPDGAIWYWAGHDASASPGHDASASLWRWDRGQFVKSVLVHPGSTRWNQWGLPFPPYSTPIRALTRDGAGDLWISSQGRGVFRQDQGVWSQVEMLKGEPDVTAYAAANDRQGRVWLSYPERKKVARWDQGSIQVFSSENGLSIDAVNALVESGREMWAGGDSGVGFFRDDNFHRVEPAEGAEFGQVSGILVTPLYGVWLTASGAIAHIPQNEVQLVLQDSHHKVQYETFDLVTDLVEPPEILPHKTAVMGTDGILWFATPRGVIRIDPAHLRRNQVPPLVAIRSVLASGRTYSVYTDPVLPPHTTRLRIAYSVLSLSIPERVRSRYRLVGSDVEWQDAGARVEVPYNNLGPGKYTFQVSGGNNDGVWNEAGASLTFTILPAFYQTAWLRLSYVAAGGMLFWLVYRLRLRQMTARVRLRYAERLDERTRIARELHDTLLQSFHVLLFRFQAVDNLLPARPGEAKQTLESALDDAAQAITEARDAVHELRSSTVVTNDLAAALTALGEELVAHHTPSSSSPDSAAFLVEVEGTPQELHPILRDEVYRITGEALRNAFRHARARRIEVDIRYDERELRVRIRDDGSGIDPSVLGHEGLAGHWGLPGMRERAERIGGHMDLWSVLGAGTEVELRIPASIAYQAKAGRSFRLFRKKMGTSS
jgi:signal transduction histidine kinase